LSGSRMFPFITKTWNPLGGECLHKCSYCWAQGPKGLIQQRKLLKYTRYPYLVYRELQKTFHEGEFVFVEDMADLFGPWVSSVKIRKVLEKTLWSPARFLFLTKNPARYLEFLPILQKTNCLLGATLETNRDTSAYSKALPPVERWDSFFELEYSPKFVAVEPIMDFDLNIFADWIVNITGLESVAIGYDNYDNKLPEPPLAKTMQLIDRLEKAGITVYRKTLREAWNENAGS